MTGQMAKLNKRYEYTKEFKGRWLGLYKELYLYVIPDRDAFNVKFNYQDQGKPTTEAIWDDTAVLSAYQRANDLHSLLMPQDRTWGRLTLDEHFFSPATIAANQETMDEINDRIFFYLNQSNLARVVSASNLDLVGGTGALWIESRSDDEPLYFRSIPAVALYIEYNTDDVSTTCWYEAKMSGRQILDTFPKYRGKSRTGLMDSPDETHTIVYGQIKQQNGNFYLYAVLEADPFTPLWETERSYQQIIVYRDKVRPGESEGRGVGLDMLPTIRDLNRVVKYDRKSLEFKAYPPMFYDADRYFNPRSVRQWAGSMIARNPQGRNPVEALQMPQYSEVLETIRHLQDVVRTGFQVDPLGEINAPVRSATEVSIRENRAQRTSATDISRLINELPKQVYEVAAKILSERKLLTRMRDAQLDVTSKKLKFDYKSPLFDLQNQENLNHLVNNMQIKQQFLGEGAALATMKLPELNEALTKWLNLPHNLFASKDEVRVMMQQFAQQQQQAALPTPQATGSQVQLPQAPGVTV